MKTRRIQLRLSTRERMALERLADGEQLSAYLNRVVEQFWEGDRDYPRALMCSDPGVSAVSIAPSTSVYNEIDRMDHPRAEFVRLIIHEHLRDMGVAL